MRQNSAHVNYTMYIIAKILLWLTFAPMCFTLD